MALFRLHTLMTAPGGSTPFVAMAQRLYGRVPNVIAELAESPQALEAYFILDSLFGRSALSPGERQVVLLAASTEQERHYCTGVHVREAQSAGVSAPVIDALMAKRRRPDARLEALRAYTAALIRTRGKGARHAAERVLAVRYDRDALLEVVVAIAQKMISTYVNHIAETPLDP